MNDHNPAESEAEDEKSKSQVKREMTALQDMGRRLAELKEQQREQFPLTEDLRLALQDYQRIRKNEAKRRQLQYIGKLMRKADHEAIAAQFELIEAKGRRNVQQEHFAEQWRDKLLEGEPAVVTDFLNHYPATERQDFRNLVRAAIQERQAGKPPAQARKLFRFIREAIAGE